MTQIKLVEGYFTDEPNHIHYVNVHLGAWNGIEDHADNDIFFYMDGEPLKVGDTIAEDFVVTLIDEVTV